MAFESMTNDGDLTHWNTARLGAIAERVVRLTSGAELVTLLSNLSATERSELNLAGELSNTTIAPHVAGTTVLYRDGSILDVQTVADDIVYRVDAGCSLDAVVAHACEQGHFGIELLAGIPGTIGAAVVQNAAAYGQAIAEVFEYAEAYDLVEGARCVLDAERLAFRYRGTTLKVDGAFTPRFALTTVVVRLKGHPTSDVTYSELVAALERQRRDRDSSRERRQTVLEVRERKGLIVNGSTWIPSSGSYFVGPRVSKQQAMQVASEVRGSAFADSFLSWYRPDERDVRVPAALVLRAAGFVNGDRWGDVGLGRHHILALCNYGAATGLEIDALGAYLQSVVEQRLAITLTPEVRFLGDRPAANEVESVNLDQFTPGAGEPSWALSLGEPAAEPADEFDA